MNRKKKSTALSVGLCHNEVVASTMIGQDIIGMAKFLEQIGMVVTLIGETIDPNISNHFKTMVIDNNSPALDFDILIYHHKYYWPFGNGIVKRFQNEIIFKFHATPHYNLLEAYSFEMENNSKLNYQLIQQRVAHHRSNCWLTNSQCDKNLLIRYGLKEENIHVVPTFNNHSIKSLIPHQVNEIKKLIYVGDFLPHKGHLNLLRVLKEYINLYGNDISLHLAGNIEPLLQNYYEKVIADIYELHLVDNVHIYILDTNAVCDDFYQQADLFIYLAEEEGFCDEILRAQAVGLPVLAADGEGVLEIVDYYPIPFLPNHIEDYVIYAELIHEILNNDDLYNAFIQAGLNNLLKRFSKQAIEKNFIGAIYPVLERLI